VRLGLAGRLAQCFPIDLGHAPDLSHGDAR
jgi:hypothetical protein